jgi:hypothetical protein
VIGAEVEHGRNHKAEAEAPAQLAAPLTGYPPDSLERDIATAPHMLGTRHYSAGVDGFLPALRKLSRLRRKTSEFFARRSAMAVAMMVS